MSSPRHDVHIEGASAVAAPDPAFQDTMPVKDRDKVPAPGANASGGNTSRGSEAPGAEDIGLADTDQRSAADVVSTDQILAASGDAAGELDSTAPASPQGARARRARQTRYHRGATIGRYIVLDTVGAGTMGTVYAAYDPELDRRIAVKLLATSQSRAPKARQRLLREARALARLSHPNVIQVYDVGMQGEDVFVAMELIEGQSLDDVCHGDARPGWREILQFYLEAARGLAAAHAVGLIHRDFKPSNVLIGGDGRVRVADFGLAAAAQRGDVPLVAGPSGDGDADMNGNGDMDVDVDVDVAAGGGADVAATAPEPEPPEESLGESLEDTATLQAPDAAGPSLEEHITDPGTIMGTPAFMAPEQHSGDEIGPQADQYSFCVALYAGLYGDLPFQPPESPRPMVALLAQKVREEIAAPPQDAEVPEWLRSVIVRGMAARPERRWPSMAALIDALQDDPVLRRRKRMRNLAAGLAMVLLTGLAAFGWLRTPALVPERACAGMAQRLDGVWDASTRQAVRRAFLATGRPHAQATFDRVASILDGYATAWIAMRTEACEATRVRGEQSEHTLDLRIYCLRQRRSRLQALTGLLVRDTTSEVLDNSVQAAIDLPPLAYCADIDALMATVRPPEDPEVRAAVENLQARLDRADALADNAGRYRESLVQALGVLDESRKVPYPPIRARAMFLVAKLRRRAGEVSKAEPLLRELIPLAARAGDDVLVARAWTELMWGLGYVQARHEEAMELGLAAEAAVERAGDELLRAELWITLGAIVYSMGQYGRAAEYEARALHAQEQALGAKHPDVAQSLNNLAMSLLEQGQYEEARPLHERALAIRTEVLGPRHPLVAQSMTNLAYTLSHLGEHERARRMHEDAVSAFEKALGPTHWLVGYALGRQGETLRRTGDRARPRAVFERALAVLELAQGNSHPRLAEPLIGLGEVSLQEGDLEQAISRFERAVVVSEAAGSHNLARSRFGLARALWDADRDRQRARALATQAEDFYRDIGHSRARERVTRWLAAHPGGP